jgi:hypothetical protein
VTNNLQAQVAPIAKPHVTNGRCWCKARVPLMVDGVKVGEGTIDHTGLFTASVSSDILAQKFTEGIVENLSIGTKFKDPEAAVETANLSRSF